MNKLTHLSSTIHRLASGRVALAATVIFVLFTALVLPRQAAEAEAASGGASSPDTSFWYTPAELYQTAEAYGPAGRQAYIRARWTFDVIWPVVYTVFLAATLSWVYRHAVTASSPWLRVNLVPIVGMGLDYLENLATSLVMARYPAELPVVAQLAPVFTLSKWLFVNGSFVLLLAGGALALWRRLRQ